VVHSAPVLRTGTDNVPILNNAVGQSVQMAPSLNDYSGLSTPSVWRNGRAAAKVDALASNGMDEIEIPAFLRKQAD
jgi:cell division protein FtsZ